MYKRQVLLRAERVEFRHTPIDIDAVCATIVETSTYPDLQAWGDEYGRAVNSDIDALRAFAPLDGRERGRSAPGGHAD